MKYLDNPYNRLFFLLILLLAIIVTSIEGNLARLGRQLLGGGPSTHLPPLASAES